MNDLLKTIFFCGIIFTTTAVAVPEQCVRLPEKKNVCEHVIYKIVRNLNAESIQGDRDVYCVCLQDFGHLILPGQSVEEREQQALDIENISKQLDITEAQLLRLIRY